MIDFFSLFFFVSGIVAWFVIGLKVIVTLNKNRFPELHVGWEELTSRERRR